METTTCVDIFAEPQAQQSLKRRFNHVGGVLGAEGFAKNIFDSGGLQDRANGFSSDDSGAGAGGTQKNFRATVMGENFVRNGGVTKRNADHLGTGHFAAFANRIGDFAGLSEADPDFAAFIADNDKGAEVKTTAAFDDLGGAVDEDDLFGQFLPLIVQSKLGGVGAGTITPATAWATTTRTARSGTTRRALAAAAAAATANAACCAFSLDWFCYIIFFHLFKCRLKARLAC